MLECCKTNLYYLRMTAIRSWQVMFVGSVNGFTEILLDMIFLMQSGRLSHCAGVRSPPFSSTPNRQ